MNGRGRREDHCCCWLLFLSLQHLCWFYCCSAFTVDVPVVGCLLPPLFASSSKKTTTPSSNSGVTDDNFVSNDDNVQIRIFPPPPPWKFQASRIFYQFYAIPTDKARKNCPPCQGQQQQKQMLSMISIGGWTLGGIFCVEYTNSPIGSYKEVAVLSSLVASFRSLAIGAWASHIFVDSIEAVKYGKEFWGLPAIPDIPNIEFVDGENCDPNDDIISFLKNFDDDVFTIRLQGWKDNYEDNTSNKIISFLLDRISLSLPSFSGLLPITMRRKSPTTNKEYDCNEYSGAATPLLQYPLSIIQPKSINIVPLKQISFDNFVGASSSSSSSSYLSLSEDKALTATQGDQLQHQYDDVQRLLEGSQPLIAIDIGPVELVAGKPKKVM